MFRELRDSFAADIWKELHIEGAMIFTQTEVPIAVFVLVLMFLIVFVLITVWLLISFIALPLQAVP